MAMIRNVRMRIANWYCRGTTPNDGMSLKRSRLTPAGAKKGRPGLLALACCMSAAMTLVSGHAVASHSDLYFSEPYTGERVQSYEITLPVSRSETGTFLVPDQCDGLMEAMAKGAMHWGSQIEKRIWIKAGNDCQYHSFLHRFPYESVQDFVSGYDFRNAALADLLVSRDCPQETGEGSAGACTPESSGVTGLSQYLVIVEASSATEDFDAASCRLDRGSFRGEVVRDANGLRCRPDPRAPGIRVLSVDYSDADGDGYLDALLRVVPIGPGAVRMPMVVGYTRKNPDEAFSVLEPLEPVMPFPGANVRPVP